MARVMLIFLCSVIYNASLIGTDEFKSHLPTTSKKLKLIIHFLVRFVVDNKLFFLLNW